MDSALHTRDKIVELGRDYILTIGYHAFNYKQIATALNIKNAAIHHYYPLKEDLGLAVIEKDRQEFANMMKLTANGDPLLGLEALLDCYGRYFKDGHKLCLVGTFCSAYHDVSEKLQIASARYLNVIHAWLTELMQDGLDSGRFNFDITAQEMANNWAAILPGSLQIGRVQGEGYFYQVMDSLRKSLKTE